MRYQPTTYYFQHHFMILAQNVCRHGNFADDFHKYELDWNEDGMIFYIDGNHVMTVDPGDEGFWNFGDFENRAPGSDNPWKESSRKMTPFDEEVS